MSKSSDDVSVGRGDLPSSASSTEDDELSQSMGATHEGGQRSKSSCFTCRRRRKKCDERKPCCQNCEEQGLQCMWATKIARSRSLSHLHAEQTGTSEAGSERKPPKTEYPVVISIEVDSDKEVDQSASNTNNIRQPATGGEDGASKRSPMTVDHPGWHRDEQHNSRYPYLPHGPTESPKKGGIPMGDADLPARFPVKRLEDAQTDAPTHSQRHEQDQLQRSTRSGVAIEFAQDTRHHVHHDVQKTFRHPPTQKLPSRSEDKAQNQPQVQPREAHKVDTLPGIPQFPPGQFDPQQQAQASNVQSAFQVFPMRPGSQKKMLPRLLPQPCQSVEQTSRGPLALFPSQYDTSSRSQPRNFTYPYPPAPTSHPATYRMSPSKTKMLKGQTYSPSNSELVYDRTKCRAMLSHFNSGENASASAEKRRQLARGILASVGVGVEIESPFRCEYGYNIRIRSGTFIGPECIIEDPCIISIGSNCVIGPRVTISGKKSSSNMNDRNGSRSLFFGSEVWIGDQVCIKTGVVIHAGVRIGRGSTILAGAVVTESIEENGKAGGNPATIFTYWPPYKRVKI